MVSQYVERTLSPTWRAHFRAVQILPCLESLGADARVAALTVVHTGAGQAGVGLVEGAHGSCVGGGEKEKRISKEREHAGNE